ncbi:MAG: glutathione S-transferase C-terminal domain-containing protein [Verrucomicrobiota bacterium]
MSQFPHEQAKDGSFNRQEDEFREVLSEATGGRYHLYVCKACPWAHRSWIVLRLMGLDDAVSVSFTDPIRNEEEGWRFTEGEGHGPDEAEGFRFLSEAYLKTNPDFKGRITVPVLWDKQGKRIINNSEDDICRMWTKAFLPLAQHPVDLFPTRLKDEQNFYSDLIYETVNNGVYKAGFATSQAAYESAVTELFKTLELMEARLRENGPYLLGDEIVETDWRFFCTLIRFDAVYHGHFKCNLKRIMEMPHLQAYMEKLYHQPGIAETVNMDHIKRHYYVTHDDINPTRIVPAGPQVIISGEELT